MRLHSFYCVQTLLLRFMRLPLLARQIAPFCFIVFLLPRSLNLVCFRVRDVVILPTSLLKPFSGHKYLKIRDGFYLQRRGQYSSPFSTESCLSIYTSLLIMLFRLRRHLCLLSRSTFLIVWSRRDRSTFSLYSHRSHDVVSNFNYIWFEGSNKHRDSSPSSGLNFALLFSLISSHDHS